MRIAVVTTSYPTGDDDASGHFVRAEVRAMRRAGHDVRVITPVAGGAFGWPGVAARLRERPWRAVEVARWMLGARRALAQLEGVDRVVAHWAVPCAWPIGVCAARAALDVVSHGGDVRLLVRLPAPLRRFVVRAVTERAREWRFVSASLRDELCDALAPNDAARVEAIARVEAAEIELPASAELRAMGAERRLSMGDGALVAVTVGRLVASKRFDVALAHAAARGARIVVVGDGPERARLESRAAALGVDARFVGKVSRTEALTWMAAADVMVHASTMEGMSTVLREAAALGLRVETP